jgi:hypothetical protein
MNRLVTTLLVVALVGVGATAAQPPQTMTYQGLLTDASGSPVSDGNYSLTFRIYDAAVGGTQLWIEIQPSVAVAGGLFKVQLGSVTPITLDFDAPYWLEVQVGAESAQVPRIELSSTPYTFMAMDIEDDAVTSVKILDGEVATADIEDDAVTAAKIAPNLVSSIDGVSNDGGDIDLVAGSNVTITPNDGANTITIAASGGGGGDITSVWPADGTLTGGADAGDAYLSVANPLELTGSSTYGVIRGTHTTGNYGYLGGGNRAVCGRRADLWGSLGSGVSGACGQDDASGNYGQLGTADYGVQGSNGGGNWGALGTSEYGVYGVSSGGEYGSLGGTVGAYGSDPSGNVGRLGGSSYGVYGYAPSGDAAWFNGDVYVSGDINKAACSFLIDHPLDPENKLLRHTCVESPEYLLVYRGRVRLDNRGEVVVAMPEYFGALADEEQATVTLTAVGKPFLTGYDWNADGRSFTAYGDPGREISWVVYADRDDPVVRQLARPVEEEKGPDNKYCDRGKLLHPAAYGYPETMGRDYEEVMQMEQEMAAVRAAQGAARTKAPDGGDLQSSPRDPPAR